MSFGFKDSDWVNPPDQPTKKMDCWSCNNGTECPCGCGMFYCSESIDFVSPDAAADCVAFEVF